MASRLLSLIGARFGAGWQCGSRTWPRSGAAGVLDAPWPGTIMAGPGKPQASGGVVCGCGRPHLPLCARAARWLPSSLRAARPGGPVAHGAVRVRSGRGSITSSSAPPPAGDTHRAPRARPGLAAVTLPGALRSGRARRAGVEHLGQQHPGRRGLGDVPGLVPAAGDDAVFGLPRPGPFGLVLDRLGQRPAQQPLLPCLEQCPRITLVSDSCAAVSAQPRSTAGRACGTWSRRRSRRTITAASTGPIPCSCPHRGVSPVRSQRPRGLAARAGRSRRPARRSAARSESTLAAYYSQQDQLVQPQAAAAAEDIRLRHLYA